MLFKLCLYRIIVGFFAHAPIAEKPHFETQLKIQVCLYYIYTTVNFYVPLFRHNNTIMLTHVGA